MIAPYSGFDVLDRCLYAWDPDSRGWNEYAHQDAARLLATLNHDEWEVLRAAWPERPQAWRRCLVTVLEPRLSTLACELLLQAIGDADSDLSYEALRRTYLYCGVQTVRGVVSVNAKVQAPELLDWARKSSSLVDRARLLADQSSHHAQAEIAAFISLLCSGPTAPTEGTTKDRPGEQ